MGGRKGDEEERVQGRKQVRGKEVGREKGGMEEERERGREGEMVRGREERERKQEKE